MIIFYFTILFLLGLSIGSFLNVVIDRLPNGKNLLGRSQADCCSRTLSVLDLIPVLSFILSFGKCRHCHKKLSFYYPMVELLTAILTLIAFSNFPLPYSIFYAVNFYFLIVFFFTDLKYGLVPVSVFLFNLIFVLSFQIYLLLIGQLSTFSAGGGSAFSGNFQLSIISALAASLFFVFLILITKGRGMGFGDVLLVFLFSLMLGFPKSVVMVFLSFILGGIFSSILLVTKKKHFGQTLPFGPFLAAGTLAALFFGEMFIKKYLTLG